MVENPTDDIDELYGPIEVADDVYCQAIYSNVIGFVTEEGIVLVDATDRSRGPKVAERLRQATEEPIHTVIYTHGHVDHVHGTECFLLEDQPDPQVIAHENMERRFKRYEWTDGHNRAINARQFGGTVESGHRRVGGESAFRTPDYPPTRTYSEALTIRVGGLTFEIRHGKGETDDHSWIYCPEKGVLCTGDFLFTSSPNAGNPQKVQRYPGEWADELERMRDVGAETVCPGHGRPIVDDSDEATDRLDRRIGYLRHIVDETLSELNDGSPPHVDIVHQVDLPDPDTYGLNESYDEAEFILRNVLRKYGGWWSGRPSELKPAERPRLAGELTDLAGGPEAVAKRAQQAAESGNLRLACHLADFAVEAAPDDSDVQDHALTVYEKRAESEDSIMAINLFRSARSYAESGRPFR
jgi:glyoxylase-like metal-dependent hydrolase (beta-lactamase superfamily II)